MDDEKNKNLAKNKRLIILSTLLLVVLLAVASIYLVKSFYKKSANDNSTDSTETENSNPESTPDENQTSDSTPNYDQAIKNDPSNPENYAKKSEELYLAGDTAGALEVVNEGLNANPDDETLKSKKDTLEKEYYNDPEASGGRQ